jgi:phosphatidate cytidylyltransferase
MVMGKVFSPLGYALSLLIVALLNFDISINDYWKLFGGCFIGSLLFHLYESRSCRDKHLLDFMIYCLGSLYITWSLYILIYMVNEGLHLFFMWMLTIVLSSDIGAYFAGRFIGGPKLAPFISPNKTWAGFFGGMILASLSAFITAPYLQEIYTEPSCIIGVSLFLSLISHVGDLLESMVKRYYDVKDSGSLLPGHGGVLDRFDSMLLVSFASIILLFSGI